MYVIRDPRDLCLSYMHHCRIFFYESFEGTNDEFIDAFLADVGKEVFNYKCVNYIYDVV